MEKEQVASESPDESSPESPAAEILEEKDEDSNVDDVESPEREEEYQDCKTNDTTKNFDFASRNSPDNPSAMEGELDFEDEECDEKEETLKENLEEDKEAAEQEKPSENHSDAAEEVVKVNLSNASEEEDGEVSEEEQPAKPGKGDGSIEEGEDEGELSDEDDLEEGEVKDSSPTAKSQARQVCRFFNRGQCTWGNLCRFLHLSVNDRGNYNMFAPSTKMMQPFSGNAPMAPRSGPRAGHEYHQPPPPPPMPPLPPPAPDPTPVESAWERGLRHAKELIKKSTRRKEQEPDFEEKRLNLSLSNEDNDRESVEFDKENDFYNKPPQRRQSDTFNSNRYDDNEDVFDNGEREAREHWRGGRYENFEIRWTRQDMHNKDRRQDKDKPRNARFSSEREKPKQWKGPRGGGSGGGGGGGGGPSNKWQDERLSEVQAVRPRADEWRDPWRRSKTPKGRRSRSRGRSHGSYSSVSSRSYSERSSHSSYSYSRSSSRSSLYSSRSPSPGKQTLKRKDSPRKTTAPPAKVLNRPSPYKRKPTALRRTQSRSDSGSRSRYSATHSRSTSSRSISRSASVSRSRSYSRSLSMDSVSSASSSISRSSGRSGAAKKRTPHMPPIKREEAKPPPPPPPPAPKVSLPKPPTTSLFDEMQRLRQYDKMREMQKAMNAAPQKPIPPPIPKEKKADVVPPAAIPTPPSDSPVKDAQKQPQQKQQIKLTLLNKAAPPKIPNPLIKKEFEAPKAKMPEKDDKAAVKPAVKRPASPPGNKLTPAAKRSTSSRRDELLKQLKAVEDAIARKRAKFS